MSRMCLITGVPEFTVSLVVFQSDLKPDWRHFIFQFLLRLYSNTIFSTGFLTF